MDTSEVNKTDILSDEPTSSDQPRVKPCSLCPATFTRKTHLNRHIRSHMNERTYRCDACKSQFTRSDLLTRHKKTCGETRSRRKSCEACAKAKVKCNLQQPCEKCTARGINCEFTNDPNVSRAKVKAAARAHRNRAGTTSSCASASTRAPSPEESAPSQDDLTLLSSSSSCDPLAPFAQLGVGSSSIGLENYLAPSPSMSFDEPTTDFMQFLTRPEDMTSADSFDFESIVGSSSGIAAGTTAADMMQISDPVFVNPSAFLSPPSNPAHDFSKFDFFSPGSGSDPSMTPGSLISSTPMSDSPPTSPPTSVEEVSHAESSLRNAQTNFVPDTELRVYAHLFFSAFIVQLPVVHEATWREDGKPPILLRVMQACGALFVRTAQAAQFVMHTLATAREEIVQEYTCKNGDPLWQMHLILAFALLQTLGMFHQRADQRRISTIYHGMLKMMIARSGLLETLQAWTTPEFYDDTPVEEAWRAWSQYETVKRLCCLAHFQDCAQVVFFAIPLAPELECEGYLPCEDALWNAPTAQDWAISLRTPSRYGSPASRLRGANAQTTLAALVERKPAAVTAHIPTFAHYLLIHTILSYIYSHIHAGTPIPGVSSSADVGSTIAETHTSHHVHAMRSSLQNWLLNWEDEANKSQFTKIPLFISDALPYYRLAQVSLLMLCEGEGAGHGRHSQSGYASAKVEVRFRVVKDWVRQMRGTSRTAQMTQADPREDLMKLRVLYANTEATNAGAGGDQVDGLLAFFPEH